MIFPLPEASPHAHPCDPSPSDPRWGTVNGDRKKKTADVKFSFRKFLVAKVANTKFGRTCGLVYVLQNNLRINIERERSV